MNEATNDRPNTPRQVNEKAQRLGYLPCDVCGRDIGTIWAGQSYGGPFIISSRDWDKPGIGLRCSEHPFEHKASSTREDGATVQPDRALL